MKKVLFFIESLSLGGAEKSIVTLLNNLELHNYEIDLKVVEKGGVFEKFIPEELSIKKVDAKPKLLSRLQYKIARLLKKEESYHPAQLLWKFIKKDLSFIDKNYDIAIAWGQGFSTYFVAECVNAKKKYAWVNVDYDKAGYDYKLDTEIYKKYDTVIAVSEFVKDSLTSFIDRSKIITIRDIVDPQEVIAKASENLSNSFDKSKKNIVSVGRLEKPKSFQFAIYAARILKNKEINFHWYIIGEGSQRAYLESIIEKEGVGDVISLLGYKENPYPYIKSCDIYCQTSIFEGLGLTVIEARILHKPIVSTNFPTAYSIIENNKTGLIKEMDPKSIADGVQQLIENKELRDFFISNLAKIIDKEKEKTLQQINTLLSN